MRVLYGFLAAALLGSPVVAGAGDQPRPLADNPRLVYPEAARLFGVTGEVSFTAEVDDNGQATRVDVQSVPMKGVGFEESVKSTVSSWRFAPAVVDGKPASGTYSATVTFRLRPPDESGVTKTMEQFAAAWNGRQVDAALKQFDLAAVPPAALGRNGMRAEAELRAWLGAQMPASAAPLRSTPRVLRFAGPKLAYVEVPLDTPAGAAPAAPLHGMLVKRNDDWRLVRLDWSEAPGETPLRAGGSGALREPRKIKHVSPAYPLSLIQAGVTGAVVLECTIDTDGNVTDTHAVSGHPRLVKLAQDAVKKWRYTPTLFEGVPVPVIMTVTVNFRMQ